MLRPGRAANGAVVLRAAVSGKDDQLLAQPVPQRLQLVEQGRVGQRLAGSEIRDLGGFGNRSPLRRAKPNVCCTSQ